MTTLRKTLIATGVAAACLAGTAAHAGLVVDLFADPNPPRTLTVNNAAASAQDGMYASILGGYRDVYINDRVADGYTGGIATLAVGGGQLPALPLPPFTNTTTNYLSINNNAGVTSQSYVTWDGSNAVTSPTTSQSGGGAGVDRMGLDANLAANGANEFLASVLGADLGFSYSIQVWDTSGNTAKLNAGIQFPLPYYSDPPVNSVLVVGVPYASNYFFDWFSLGNGTYCQGNLIASPTNQPTDCPDILNDLYFTITDRSGGSINFEHIGAMQLGLYGVNNADFALGLISTVPEPASLALVGLGLMGMAGLRRRKQS